MSSPSDQQPSVSLSDWKALPKDVRTRIRDSWNPYAGDGQALVDQIVAEFEGEHGDLPGILEITRGLYHGGEWVIAVDCDFVFDRCRLPPSFLGVRVHARVMDLPPDFRVFESYVWAPENFERYIEAHGDEVRVKLGDPQMSRDEMLHALCGMPFDDWVEQCRKWGPTHTAR